MSESSSPVRPEWSAPAGSSAPNDTRTQPRPRLLFLVTEDWYFCSHRLPVARAARDAGFEVAVAARVDRHGDRIRAEGFRLLPVDWNRATRSPLKILAEWLRIVRLYRQERPDLVHHVAIKPAVLGALAALVAGTPAVLTTLAGRGVALSGSGLVAQTAGLVLRSLLTLVSKGKRAGVVVQNADDGAWLQAWPAVPQVHLVPGSGVDLQRYQPLPEPAGPITVAQVSRMLTLKGVEDLVAAVQALRNEGLDMRLILAGAPDPTNPAGLTEAQLRGWAATPGIEWLGHVDDVRMVWARAHIAVLASRGGEGVPKSLLEAAACGRPLVATDVSGIRDIARPGSNALLVPPRNPAALSKALRTLAMDAALRKTLADAGSRVVAQGFDERLVAERTLAIYRSLLPTPRA